MLDPCQPSNNNWKRISFDTTWLHPKLKKIIKKTSSFSLSFSPSLAGLYIFEQCLRLGVTSTSCVCLPHQDESLHVFPNCMSLWKKASAKWLNVNVKEGLHWCKLIVNLALKLYILMGNLLTASDLGGTGGGVDTLDTLPASICTMAMWEPTVPSNDEVVEWKDMRLCSAFTTLSDITPKLPELWLVQSSSYGISCVSVDQSGVAYSRSSPSLEGSVCESISESLQPCEIVCVMAPPPYTHRDSLCRDVPSSSRP